MDKSELRNKSLTIRRDLENKVVKSNIIVNKILNGKYFNNAHIIGLYYPLKDEVDIKQLIGVAIKENKVVCLPRVINDKEMCFIKISSFSELEIGSFNIYEPKYNQNNVIDKSLIELFIVPGLCFDESYNRLGYGRGYYDRYLINTKGYKIGVTFKELFFKKDTIIAGLTDIKMDKIIKD